MKSSVVATLAVGLMVAPSTVQGYAKYVKLVPNGGNVPDNSNIGHLDPAGETGVSDFGKAFATAGNAWNTALCQLDTDGDGYTNGQELGDPCCTWTSSNTAGLVTDGVSDPSDATKTPTSSALKAGCSSGGTSTNTGSGDSIGDVVGTVAPAGGDTGEMPPDDDENDDDESAVLTAGASVTTISSVAMALAAVIAAAVAF
ncbi:Temptin [Phytophthora citrophthora]|uniref:Temptin n=1 Tax=Phytophthora citrophthora TaxID=4793 RepID=A0AAD9GPE5_9STRA|nr:Temptin [Phytophthora citrophthora]